MNESEIKRMTNKTAKIETYQGDSAELLPELGYFDYLITDPPYPVGASNAITSKKGVTESRLMIDSMAQSFFMMVFRIIKKNPNFKAWIFCDWRQVSFLANALRLEGFNYQSCVVWDKMRTTFSGLYHPSHELVLFVADEKVKLGHIGRDLISQKPDPQNVKVHAYQKSAKFIAKLCEKFPAGRTVDPFAGSGSTLVACEMMGWDCVGIDTRPIMLIDNPEHIRFEPDESETETEIETQHQESLF